MRAPNYYFYLVMIGILLQVSLAIYSLIKIKKEFLLNSSFGSLIYYLNLFFLTSTISYIMAKKFYSDFYTLFFALTFQQKNKFFFVPFFMLIFMIVTIFSIIMYINMILECDFLYEDIIMLIIAMSLFISIFQVKKILQLFHLSFYII